MPPLLPLGVQHVAKLQALTPRFKDLYSGRKAAFEVTIVSKYDHLEVRQTE
jgi:hypothetical protein